MPLLTKVQAAIRLGEQFNRDGVPFGCSTLNRWMAHQAMPHFKVGQRAMFDSAAITRWANARFVRNPEPVSR